MNAAVSKCISCCFVHISRYITNTKVNSAFYPSGVGKSSTGLHGWGKAFTCVGWQVTLCAPIWQVTLRSSVMGFQSVKSYTHLCLLPCSSSDVVCRLSAGVLRVETVSFDSLIRIQSNVSRDYLCFNRRGRLVVKVNTEDESNLTKRGIAVASPLNSSFLFARWQHRTDGVPSVRSCIHALAGGLTPNLPGTPCNTVCHWSPQQVYLVSVLFLVLEVFP